MKGEGKELGEIGGWDEQVTATPPLQGSTLARFKGCNTAEETASPNMPA